MKSGSPVVGRDVHTVTGGSYSATTDGSGNYTISGVPAGSYTLYVTLVGGETSGPSFYSFTITTSNVTGKDFELFDEV